MIKKIILLLMCLVILASCGRKGDPEYKDPEKKTEIQSTLINKA